MRTRLYITSYLAVFALLIFNGQLRAQSQLDKEIDSLQRSIAQAAPDTGKISLYLAILPKYHLRYALFGNATSDSLAFVRGIEDCRTLSTKLNFIFGRGTTYVLESYFNYFLGHIPKRDTLLAQAFSIFHSANDKKGLANAWFYKAEMWVGFTTDSAKIVAYDSAIQYARESGDLKKEAQASKGRAYLRSVQGKHAQAIQELLEVLEQQKKRGDDQIHYTTDLLGVVYAASGNHKEALRYSIASLDYARMNNDTTRIVTFYQRLGGIYFDMYNYDKSYYYYAKALSAFKPGKPGLVRVITIAITSHMAGSLMHLGNYQEAFRLLSDFQKKFPAVDEKSLDHLHFIYLDLYYYTGDYRKAEQKLLQLLQHVNDWHFVREGITRIYTRAGQIYWKLNQPYKAALYSDSAFASGLKFQDWRVQMENSLTLYRVDSMKGNYLDAMRYQSIYKAASDSLQKDISDKHLAELSVQFETDQKNTELALLANKTQLQQETIQQGQLLRNVMIASSALLLLLLFVTYNRYRIKRKANTLLQEKQQEINRQNNMLEKMVLEEKMITEEKDKLLAEKEWLMKEINHRVKNNLQVVMSLLNTQSSYLKDEAALKAIQESRHRVHAISLIHRKLYQSDRLLTVIDMSTYIREVVEYLAETLDVHHRITFGLFIDPIVLDVTQAVPTGLIINEAVTNSVKYAFPGDQKGKIDIYMYKTPEGHIELLVSDNGIGLPENFDWQHTESLGMSLMNGLSRQLDGNFEVVQKNGLTIKIIFGGNQLTNEEKIAYS